MGHFRVKFSLNFKASLHSKSLLWVSIFILIKTINIPHFDSLWRRVKGNSELVYRYETPQKHLLHVFFFSVAHLQIRRKTLVNILRPPLVFPNLRSLSTFRKYNIERVPQASFQMLFRHWPRSLKQALWRRQQERRLARAFVFFAAALVVSTTWNDLFYSCLDGVSIRRHIFNAIFQSPNRSYQLSSRIIKTHF